MTKNTKVLYKQYLHYKILYSSNKYILSKNYKEKVPVFGGYFLPYYFNSYEVDNELCNYYIGQIKKIKKLIHKDFKCTNKDLLCREFSDTDYIYWSESDKTCIQLEDIYSWITYNNSWHIYTRREFSDIEKEQIKYVCEEHLFPKLVKQFIFTGKELYLEKINCILNTTNAETFLETETINLRSNLMNIHNQHINRNKTTEFSGDNGYKTYKNSDINYPSFMKYIDDEKNNRKNLNDLTDENKDIFKKKYYILDKLYKIIIRMYNKKLI